MLILRGVPPLGDVKQRWGGKQAILKLNASISRKLSEIRPKLLLTTNGKWHMRFRLIPGSMTLDDLELYKFEFLGISQIWDATTAKRQRQRCNH